MKRIITLALLLFIAGSATEAYSQSWLKKLGKKVEEKAKQKVEEKAEKAVDKAFDKAEDAATDAVKGKDKKDKTAGAANNANADGQAVAQDGGQQQKSATMSWNKFDFVPGDEIIFEDLLAGEQLGEFPSMWDMTGGNIEIANLDGENVIALLGGGGGIFPLMKEADNYLPESFTIEADFYITSKDERGTAYYGFHIKEGRTDVIKINFAGWPVFGGNKMEVKIQAGDKSVTETPLCNMGWNRISISFNKRALKVYFNENRIANIPNCPEENILFLPWK